MILENQEFIGTREASLILRYEQGYMRVLCSDMEFREKVSAQKFAGRWVFKKDKIIEYGKEKGRISDLN